MVFSRAPGLMTKRLRHIITRDTIIVTHIAFSIAAILDSFYIQYGTTFDRILIIFLTSVFIIVGFIRLKLSDNERSPMLSIIAYMIIGTPAIAYLSDIRSFWPFFWLIPIFLSSFYYGKKMVYLSYGWFAGCLGLQLILQKQYITNKEDYLYVIAELLIVGALGMLFRDTLEISKEDRVLLLTSLEKLEIEESRLNTLINSISDGVIAVDQGKLIVFDNPAAMSIIDTHKSLVGKHISEVLHITTMADTPIDLNDWLAHPKQNREAHLTYDDGEIATLTISIASISSGKSRHKDGSVILLRDITKQRSLEVERNAFVSLMSHELRTPLTIAEGAASNAEVVFGKNNNAGELLAAIKQIHEQVSHLVTLTNEFSLVIDSGIGNDAMLKSKVRLSDICEIIEQAFRTELNSKGVSFDIKVDKKCPPAIFTSKEYLNHILSGLLTNALKFTSVGKVELKINYHDDIISFQVSDTGIGIARADQPKIFTPFYQSEDFETRTHGGVGIGLFVAKRLARILGGDLGFTSTLGKGSKFTLKIPSNI